MCHERKNVFAYLGAWAAYREGRGKFIVNDIAPNLCDYLIYAFFGIDGSGSVEILDRSLDVNNGNIRQFNELKSANPSLKTLASIGGAKVPSSTFSKVAASASLRSTFAINARRFCKEHGFDGIDIDWEVPSSGDRSNFVQLLAALASELHSAGLILTVAVVPSESRASESYDIPGIARHADYILLMTYDYNYYGDGYTGHNAPLYAGPSDRSEFQKQLNIDHSVSYWRRNGAPAHKLILGVPAYGKTFKLANTRDHDLRDKTIGAGNAGRYTKEAGILAYYEVLENLQNGWTRSRDSTQKVPYAYSGDQWMSYDDSESIADKCNYVVNRNLGGVMMWTIDMDDFDGNFGYKYPLLKKVNEIVKPPQSSCGCYTIYTCAQMLLSCCRAGFEMSRIKSNNWKDLEIRRNSEGKAISSYSSSSSKKLVVSYLGSWAVYRTGRGKFNISDIDPNLCDYLIYAFFGIDEKGEVIFLDSWTDLEECKGRGAIRQFNQLKSANPSLKTLASFGGVTFESEKFLQVAADSNLRSSFAVNARLFCKAHDFDGVDLAWRDPSEGDRWNFVQLLAALARELHDSGLILTVAVGAIESRAPDSYDINCIARYVDYIFLMAFDYNGFWPNHTCHNAPLYAGPSDTTEFQRQLNIDHSVQHWLREGAPANKLILGVPAFGKTFRLSNELSHGVQAPSAGPGVEGPYTKDAGILAYYEVLENLQNGWIKVKDDTQMVPYAYSGDQWMSYEDKESISNKCKYVSEHNLGGIVMWSIDTDDFRGSLGCKYPLLQAVNQRMQSVTEDSRP
ncbi:uncharacterized protein LOC125959239 [Anopheles darlingi]|uniref:uncharacterized protein LOC125959239 n=1 Tax=Anopheles darlingi TaxID=43151 RepID=UPI0021000CCC|nr:uncharacterized protein LOC125959239 [Anopheles darlingi]